MSSIALPTFRDMSRITFRHGRYGIIRKVRLRSFMYHLLAGREHA